LSFSGVIAVKVLRSTQENRIGGLMRSILAGGHRRRLATDAPKGSTRRRLMVLLGCLLVVAAVVAPGASAAKPTMERFEIDETFDDGFLTEACGVPVTTHAEGHVIVRTFSGDKAGPAQLTTLSIALTATAGDNSYRFRDVGADHVQVKQDGTEILMIVGQVPFGFTGVLKIDLATDEVILEPQHSLEGRVEEACAALTA
jgi:hypothetical protein